MSVPSLPSQPRLAEASIDGNSHFSTREIVAFMGFPAGAPLTKAALDSSLKRLAEAYKENGYYRFAVDSVAVRYAPDSLRASVYVRVSEGAPSVVARFDIAGASALSPGSLLQGCETAVGKPLRKATLESDIEAILSKYDEAGRPLAAISVDPISFDSVESGNLDVRLRVSEGPFVRIAEIDVEGNFVTRKDVIVRETFFRPGEPYRRDRAERMRRRIERLGYFTSVSEPRLYLLQSPGTSDTVSAGLIFSVTEGAMSNFDGIAGYIPAATKGEEGYFTGNVDVSMRNLFGTGRRFTVHWERENQLTQDIAAGYREPWIGGFPVNGALDLSERKQDSSYVKWQFGASLDLVISDELSAGLVGSTESVYPSSTTAGFTTFESQAFTLGARLMYDTRDNPRNPTSGVSYSTSYERGNKEITGPAAYLTLAPARSASLERAAMDLQWYVMAFARQVIAVGLHGRRIGSTVLDPSDLVQIGGAATLRGYRERQFSGSQVAWSNLEYRWLVGRGSSLYGFLDAGWISRPSDAVRNIQAFEVYRYGYGVGARFDSALGLLSVSFALGEGDTFSTAKLHFGIANDF